MGNLARSARRNVLASTADLASSNAVTRPSPSRAGVLSAKNVHIGSRRADRSLDVLNRKTSDRNSGGGSTRRRTVLIILLNHNTIIGNARESDVFVSDAGDGTGGAVDSLDSNAVLGVLDCGGGDGNGLHDIVGTATDGADREAVATRAGAAGEGDVSAGVDGEAVVLILAGILLDF